MSLPANPTQPEIALNERAQIEYLLGNPPSWMMRYGISVLAGFFVLLLALAWFIHYPDIVEARVILTTANPPIRVMAKSGGRVTELLVTDRQAVEAGTVLAVLESTTAWRDGLRLEAWLDSAGAQPHTDPPDDLQLGELQNIYSTYHQHYNNLEYFVQHNGVPARIGFLYNQIEQLTHLNANLRKQQTIMRSELALSEKEYRRQQRLRDDGVISDKEFETSEAQFLAQKRQYENTESAFLQNQMQVRQLEGQINDLQQAKSDSYTEKSQTLAEDALRLRSAIAEWKQRHLVTAPIGGQVSLTKIWSAQQPITAGEEVLAIVPYTPAPENPNAIVGKATVPALNFGKLISGQRVIVRLDGYPAQQYGSLETTLTATSLLPQQDDKESHYLLDLYFPDSLITTQGKYIPLHQEMSGVARIVTEDRRVLERMLGSLRELLRYSSN